MGPTLLAVLAVLAAGSVWLARSRMRSDHDAHARDGLAHFKAAFADRPAPEVLLDETYRYLLERREAAGEVGDPHYVIAPGHDLRTVYHFQPLDIEDAVVSIADRARGRLPKASDLDVVKERVRTVTDLILFLEPYFLDDGTTDDEAPGADAGGTGDGDGSAGGEGGGDDT